MTEQWVDAFGYEDRYLASSLGRIRHKNPRKGVGALQAFVGKCSGGYARVCICRKKPDGSFFRARSELVHRIIWQSFNGPITDGLQVNHKSGNKADNRLSNLELVTGSQNTKHAYDVLGRVHPLRGTKNKNAKLTEADIPVIRERIKNGDSKDAIAAHYGVTRMVIFNISWGKSWAHV